MLLRLRLERIQNGGQDSGCDEATVNAAACDAYKAATPDDTTSDAYKAACDAASTLYMGAAMVAAAAALAF